MKIEVKLINQNIPELMLADIARVSTNKSALGADSHYTEEANTALIKNLYKLGHWSIFEFLNVIFLIDAPLFVRDQLIRYRCASYNVRSFRKCEPEPIENPESTAEQFYNEVTLNEYRKTREDDVKKEDARALLPACTPTQWIAQYNARELFHIFSQRLTAETQKATFICVSKMFDAFKASCPLLSSLYIEHSK